MPRQLQLRILVVVVLVAVLALVGVSALGATGAATGRRAATAGNAAHDGGAAAVTRAAATPSATPHCFGAASLGDPRHCHNPALNRLVRPLPSVARHSPNAPCSVVAYVGALKPCGFGAPETSATATIALVGDSHAENWRGAVAYLARAKGWYGVSLALGGCPYSTTTRVVPEPLRSHCAARNADVPAWFRAHPEVSTVFVAQISGVPFVLPPGTPQFEGQVEAYLKAWDALPQTVRHIIVIRDTPKALPGTRRCIETAVAHGRAAGTACRMPRNAVLAPDAAGVAAQRSGGRAQVVDLVNHFCDRRWCYPVVGGALVQKDLNHLSATFIETLGPYLMKEFDQLSAGWQ